VVAQRIPDFAAGTSHAIALEPGHDPWLIGFADDASMRVKIDESVVQITLDGARTELCTDCLGGAAPKRARRRLRAV
jgi:hypothetical protein